MKALKLISTVLLIIIMSSNFMSCKYDDNEIWDSFNKLKERVAMLEKLCKQNNENISSLQTIVSVLESGDYITGIVPITNDDEEIGYKITFAKAGTITIHHGQNGKDGENGKDGQNGADGKDGHTPIVGVKKDVDGVYYWTIDGEFVEVDGQKMYVQGKDGKDGENGKDGEDGKDGTNGKDGVNGTNGKDGKDGKDGLTPQFKIENGYWYISYNGVNWTKVGKATGDNGSNGDCIFSNITQDDENVYFTLADGTVITIAKKDYFSKNIDFSSEAGEKTFYFTSNVDWTISVAPTMNGETWCSVTPKSGLAGQNTIKVCVVENVSYDDRNVVLTLSAGQSLSKTITVTQKQKDALSLTTNKFEVDSKGGKINVVINSNVDYDIVIPESSKQWISLSSKSRGLTTSTITFDIAETDEYNKREGEIIIKDGELSETIHVYQTGQEILLLTKNEYIVKEKGETIAVEIKSNFSFDVQMPNVDWINDESKSRGISSHTLYYSILPNDTYDHRETEIIFYDKNSSIKDTLKIIQLQKDAIILSQNEYNVNPGGEIIDVKLNTNVDPQISIDCDWIKLLDENESRSLLDHNLKFEISSNTSDNKRSALISISNASNSLTEVVQVHQESIPVIKSIEILQAGTISEYITEAEKYHITDLTVEGEINGTDVKFIREMAGYDADGNETEGKLVSLDLSNATIIEGGDIVINYGTSFDGYSIEDMGYGIGRWMTNDVVTKNNQADYMFIGLKKIEKIILPNNLERLGNLSFYGCHSIKSITIPKSLDYFNNQQFFSCLSLEAVYVEDGHEYLESKGGCLYEVKNGIRILQVVPASFKTFEITNDIDGINIYAFVEGNSLEEIFISKDAIELNPYYYDNFFKLQKFIVDKKNNRYATVEGVLYSKDLETIECYPSGRNNAVFEIPKGVKTIGDGCFNKSYNLQKIIIPEGVVSIGSSAFFDCRHIEKITLPSTVKSLGSAAFQHIKFKSFTCLALTPPIHTDSNVFFYYDDIPIEKMFVPKESVELYKKHENWKKFADCIFAIE